MKPKDDYNLAEKIKINFKGMPYYVMPRYKTHYVDNDYERFSLEILRNNLSVGKTLLDVGAHYGAYSLYAANAAGSKVIAVEPVNENFQLLNQNIKMNNLNHLITTYNCAASDNNGEANFNIPWASDSAGFYEHPNAETIRTQKVKVTKLDDLLQKTSVDLIKIDTEGHELSVLAGLQHTLTDNPQAKLIIELNPECLKRAGKSVEELLETISLNHKDIYIIDEDKFTLIRLTGQLDNWEKYVERSGYANLYCVPSLAKQLYPLFVSHSPDFNGAEKALVDQACALRDQGVLAHIVVPDEGPLEERLTELGISHGDVGEYYFMVNRTGEDPALDSQKNKTNIETSVAIAQLTERINPTAIVNNSIVNPWGYPAARSNGLPLFWMVHEYGDIDHALEFEHGLSVIREFIVKESEAVFCASESIKQSLLTRDNSLDKKVVVTYNLINESAVEALSNAVIKQPFTGGKSTVKLCIVGMVKERKGQVIAIKAVDALRKIGVKAELLVIGDGSKEYIGQLKALVDTTGLKDDIKFLGRKDNPYPYMRAADAVLVCSNNEAFGRVTAEAMIIGVPVIGSNAGGTAELVENNVTGLLFKPLSVNDLVAKIQKLTRIDKLKMIEDARKKISNILDPARNLNIVINLLSNPNLDPKRLEYGRVINSEWVEAIATVSAKINDLNRLESQQRETTQILYTEVDKLRKVNETLNTSLEKLVNSRSWKVTAPLRKVSKLIKRGYRS